MQLFEKFFSDDIYNLLQVETERYAKCTKNLKDFAVTSDELGVFVGFLLFSGYHILPSEKLYWSVDEDAGQKRSDVSKYLFEIEIGFSLL